MRHAFLLWQELADSQASCSKLRAEIEELQKKPVEVEKKLAQSRQVLQNARNKMMIQKAQLEKLEAENKELKESTLAAQHSLTTGSSSHCVGVMSSLNVHIMRCCICVSRTRIVWGHRVESFQGCDIQRLGFSRSQCQLSYSARIKRRMENWQLYELDL